MGRRKRTSPAEEVMNLVALLPWWAGLLLAVVFYVALHAFATQPVAPAPAGGGQSATVTHAVWRGLAAGGQYLLPLLCLAGAFASAWRRHERRRLAANVTRSPSADALNGMTWQQFERLVGEAFRQHGYRVEETGGRGADGGIDLVLRKGGEKTLVQCKQWRALKVGVDVVRELYGAMAAAGAAGGFVVTSGSYTAEARAFASGRNVTLIDGPALHRMLPAAEEREPAVVAKERSVGHHRALLDASAPPCPLCEKTMKRRVAKRGAAAGEEFWGCSAYPGCRGKRPISSR